LKRWYDSCAPSKGSSPTHVHRVGRQDTNVNFCCFLLNLALYFFRAKIRIKICASLRRRVAIPEETKFLTVSMAPSRGNKQALCGIFQYVLTTTNPPHNLKFSSSQRMHIVQVKRNLLIVKIPDVRAFFKIISGHLTLKFRTCLENSAREAALTYGYAPHRVTPTHPGSAHPRFTPGPGAEYPS